MTNYDFNTKTIDGVEYPVMTNLTTKELKKIIKTNQYPQQREMQLKTLNHIEKGLVVNVDCRKRTGLTINAFMTIDQAKEFGWVAPRPKAKGF